MFFGLNGVVLGLEAGCRDDVGRYEIKPSEQEREIQMFNEVTVVVLLDWFIYWSVGLRSRR